ncbi:type VI secretion protein [Idiomarina sp. M1R2S28]|uniref:Type VI secretion protein n=1 Tax=Idiomarina rhizosphaerae TaxID=2961572 RepID=A0A9X2FTJ1_9GAMM|nr:type VI secretion protein [Idiomarina rhizosphaerae]MCP1338831.1 type VI secretion protein [Idiomarina rhizosphaerae]
MYKTLLGATLLLAAGSVNAQQEALQQCAGIEDSLERLVCYDNIAKQSQGESKQAEGKARGKAQAEKQKSKAERRGNSSLERAFGMEHKDKEEGQLDRIEVEVAAKEQGPYDKWRIELSNGQIWKQTDSGGYFPWDEDDTYYIERGALNSFFFGREGSNRRMRVQRVK